VQASRLDELLAKRERVAGWYGERLAGLEGVVRPAPAPWTTRMSWFVYVVRLAPSHDRDRVIRELEASKAAVDIFGADVVAHYLNAARVEQETYDAIVHPWDRERYLERG